MSQQTRQLCHNERGSTILELSISLMLFLFMAFGVIEYGSILNERNALTQVAREGASLASRNLTTNQNMMDLLESTDNALEMSNEPIKISHFLGANYRWYGGEPHAHLRIDGKGRIKQAGGYETPLAPDCDLDANLMGYLTYDAGLGYRSGGSVYGRLGLLSA